MKYRNCQSSEVVQRSKIDDVQYNIQYTFKISVVGIARKHNNYNILYGIIHFFFLTDITHNYACLRVL